MEYYRAHLEFDKLVRGYDIEQNDFEAESKDVENDREYDVEFRKIFIISEDK